MKTSRKTLIRIAAGIHGHCRFDEPMSRHTSFRIGGPADLLAVKDLRDDVSDAFARVATEIGATGVTHDADIAKVSLVGAGMKTSPGIAASQNN